ncbi:hypothetical protein niasHT_025845 [Heterodera trifolii]|uniref:Uncharacterized protein n=1 Tax=Heterodera trifolii TaxID=157864 RepID=A0ABD2KJ20_9BILA
MIHHFWYNAKANFCCWAIGAANGRTDGRTNDRRTDFRPNRFVHSSNPPQSLPFHPIRSMATTLASITLQLLVLGTVIHLSYEIECWHSFRAVGHTKGQPLPAEFKQIVEVQWNDPDMANRNATSYPCNKDGIPECATGWCIGGDGADVFRINGCRNRENKCLDEFDGICKNKKGSWECKKCNDRDSCNNNTELEKGRTTLNIHIESMPFSGATGAMPTTAIGTASAKLIIAIIGNAVLLLTMRGHHNGGKKGCRKTWQLGKFSEQWRRPF